MPNRKISPPRSFPFSARRLRSGAVICAALGLALSQFSEPAGANGQTKTPHKNVKRATVKTVLPAARQIPPQETVSGLKRRIAELKRAAAARREREEKDGDKDPDKDRDKAEAGKAPENQSDKTNDREDEDGTDYYEAYLYYLQQRAYPNDRIDWRAYTRARTQRDALPPAQIGKTAAGAPHANVVGAWQFVGPNNLPVPYRTYYGLGPLNGRVNAMAYDPVVAGTYYMATAGGGLWRSTNSGQNWTPLSDGWTSLQTSSIAIDPTDHNTIYVGTGDFDGQGSLGFGIMKTTDGGATWKNIGASQFGRFAVKAIAIDPENPQILTVAPGHGPGYYGYLWRSTDGGATWKSVLTVQAPWSALSYSVADANGSRHLYATGHLYGGQVYRSDDRGITWTKLAPPLSNVNWYDHDSLRIAASAVDAQTVYLIDGFDQKLFVSRDAGATWTNTTSNFSNQWQQAWYDLHLECGSRLVGGVPTDTLYVGLIDLSQSRDGGATWQNLGGPTYTGNAILHNDQHFLALNPNGLGEALVGCDGGAFRLNDNLSTNVWSFNSLNRIAGATQYYRMAVHPTDPTRILGGAQDNATPAALGNLSAWRNVGGGDGGFCAIKNSNIQFATSQNLGLSRTDNGWSGSYGIAPNIGGDKVAFIAPITLDAAANYLYAGTNHLYQYNIAQNTWAAPLGSQLLASNVLLAIGVAPSNPNRLYTGSDSGEVWTSGDGGATWRRVDSITSYRIPNRAVTSFAPSPTAPTSVLVGVSGTGTGHLWRCIDVTAGSPLWFNVSGSGATALPDVALNSIALDTDSPATTWYVATDVGVFMTTDTGSHWANMTAPLGLPNVQVNDLQTQAATKTLYAATYGRGIWKIQTGIVTRTISGVIALQGVPDPTAVSPAAPIGPLTVEFRTVGGGGAVYTRTVTLPASGAFSFSDIPIGNYTVAVKAPKWIRAIQPADATNGNVAGLLLSLPGGDSNNDNTVDSSDFTLLIGAYNSDAAIPGSGYDPGADFNSDGSVDASDFTILIGSYNTIGPN